jgi:hypothetical protein
MGFFEPQKNGSNFQFSDFLCLFGFGRAITLRIFVPDSASESSYRCVANANVEESPDSVGHRTS